VEGVLPFLDVLLGGAARDEKCLISWRNQAILN